MLLSVSAASAAFAAASLPTPLGGLPGGPVEATPTESAATARSLSAEAGTPTPSPPATTKPFAGRATAAWSAWATCPAARFFKRRHDVSADGSVIVAGLLRLRPGSVPLDERRRHGGIGYPPASPAGILLAQPPALATTARLSSVLAASTSTTSSKPSAGPAAAAWAAWATCPHHFLEEQRMESAGDGSVVVGGLVYQGDEAFRWTSDGGTVVLDGNPLGGSSGAYGVNADGSVLVGFSNSVSGPQAFRWTSNDGMVGLGILPGNVSSEARGVSGDGLVVVGHSYSDSSNEAFRWTSDGGMERLWDVLVDHGINPAADGWTTLGMPPASARRPHDRRYRRPQRQHRSLRRLHSDCPRPSWDFNFDGNVDTADYVAWRKTDRTPDGYNTWRSNFGRTSGSGLAASENPVPEPSSLILLALSVPAGFSAATSSHDFEAILP